MSDCIFCKIINNQIPSKRLFEDDKFIVILDAFPASKYHILVIPKEHHEKFSQLSDEDSHQIGKLVRDFCKKLESVGVEDYNILNNNGLAAGQVVKHIHVHIIPKSDNQGANINFNKPTIDIEQAFNELK